ncbi:MAG: hypothetical protein ACTSPI_16965 [Candidatus Heimdallarchaeaceae archaeon]
MGAMKRHNYYYWKYKYNECQKELASLKRELVELRKVNKRLVDELNDL